MGWKDFLSLAIGVAPYAAAPFTGGGSLAFAPAAGAAAGALKGSENGWKGALMGGTMGLATSAIPMGSSAAANAGGNAAMQAMVPEALQASQPSIWSKFIQNGGLEMASKMAAQAAAKGQEENRYAEKMQDSSLRKLQTADYIASGGAPADPYGFITPPSKDTISGAAALREQLRKQLARKSTPSALDQVFDVAGPALGVWDSFVRPR